MRFFKFSFLNLGLALLVIFILVFGYKFFNPKAPEWVMATVERGDVTELVSVSGFVEAKQIANIAFPTTGRVTDVFVEEGSIVQAGEVLATLASTQLVAERNEASASLAIARAAYQETAAGPRTETIALAEANISGAEANLERVKAEESRKVENARAALYSTGLTATAIDPNEASIPPIVSGSYRCETEGKYMIEVYRSSSDSGYSYHYSGLETGTALVSVVQPAAIGNCGLYLHFTGGNSYTDSKWQIEIPNTRSNNYNALNNAYILASTQAKNTIAAAENSLNLARKEAGLSTAPARSESIRQAEASIAQAEARVRTIDARLTDRSVVAPFAGIVTKVSITAGETAPATPVISVLADNTFTLKARIPEIDITKISVSQSVETIFDAKSDETLTGKITNISPVATQIDGVAYFEVIIALDQNPSWLRAGLNADVDIIIEKRENVLRIPKRYLMKTDQNEYLVAQPRGNKTASTSIEVLFSGNDGFVEIGGLSEGEVVIIP